MKNRPHLGVLPLILYVCALAVAIACPHSVLTIPLIISILAANTALKNKYAVVVIGGPAIWIDGPKGAQGAQRDLNDLKRGIDIAISTIALAITLPPMVLIALAVKLTTRGPVLFIQERVGKNNKPFQMIKFRSMHLNAEPEGPALARLNDPRITRIGRILRKSRLDELPQLWNVLKGDMTLVGPRPERQFFIDLITERAPNYARLQRLKPGLTSLGIVRFGYASTVEEMIDRQRHDQYYFENRSLALDLRILAETLDVVLRRKGK
jgi:lipopolysaccharide/colanic/teichoic acid biosynthesis glycosyltransferase